MSVRNISRLAHFPVKERLLTGGAGNGIKSTVKDRSRLLAQCKHCKCQRYTPCGCEGAVKERESKTEAA